MKLFVYDSGDPSVGIFPTQWEIECPFEKEDMNEDELHYFKIQITNLYIDYVEGKISVYYDFEMEEENKYYENLMNNDENVF